MRQNLNEEARALERSLRNSRNQQRPGDLRASVLHAGRFHHLYVDFGVVSEIQRSKAFYVGATAGLANVSQTEQMKIAKYAELGFGPSATFIPAVASTLGAWGNHALEAFKFMAYHVAEANLSSRTLELRKLRVLMSTTVMKLVASDLRQVLSFHEAANKVGLVGSD